MSPLSPHPHPAKSCTFEVPLGTLNVCKKQTLAKFLLGGRQ